MLGQKLDWVLRSVFKQQGYGLLELTVNVAILQVVVWIHISL